jgi:hypothetical protein
VTSELAMVLSKVGPPETVGLDTPLTGRIQAIVYDSVPPRRGLGLPAGAGS